jgi:hypothetical protein
VPEKVTENTPAPDFGFFRGEIEVWWGKMAAPREKGPTCGHTAIRQLGGHNSATRDKLNGIREAKWKTPDTSSSPERWI